MLTHVVLRTRLSSFDVHVWELDVWELAEVLSYVAHGPKRHKKTLVLALVHLVLRRAFSRTAACIGTHNIWGVDPIEIMKSGSPMEHIAHRICPLASLLDPSDVSSAHRSTSDPGKFLYKIAIVQFHPQLVT